MIVAILGAQNAYEKAGFTYGQRYKLSTLELYLDDDLRLELRIVGCYVNKCLKTLLVKSAEDEISDELSKSWCSGLNRALANLKHAAG